MYTYIHKVVFIVTKTLFLYDLQWENIGNLAAISSYILNARLRYTDDVIYNYISDYPKISYIFPWEKNKKKLLNGILERLLIENRHLNRRQIMRIWPWNLHLNSIEDWFHMDHESVIYKDPRNFNNKVKSVARNQNWAYLAIL